MEEEYKLIFNTINQGVVFRDSDGHITSINPAAEEFFEGIIKTSKAFPKFLVDDHVHGAIHEDGTSFPVETHPSNRALETGKKIENIVMGAPHNGEYKWFKVNAIPLFQSGELKPYQVYTVFEDISSLKKSKDALDESKNRYKRISTLVNNYAYSVIINESNNFEYEWVINSFYNILGVSEEYLKSNRDLMFPVYPEDKNKVRKQFSNLKAGDKRSELIRLLTYDKKLLWAENHIECVEEDGVLRVYGAVRDITLRREYYLELEKSLQDKELLLSEIHHRVKNNLQIITSLLNLESNNIHNKETEEFYRITQSRIKSIALVHQKLYETPDISQINTASYIKQLIENIISIYHMPYSINLEIKIDKNIALNLDTTIPCGLIINELLTNSIKYAFPENRGNITLEWKQNAENYVLTFSDDGIGLPKNINLETTDNLGLNIIKSLVNQINGTITLKKTQGTQYTITFKELQYKKRI